MIIELHGAGFYNKGAELMLRTAVAELSQRLDDVTFAVDPTVGPYEKRGKLGLRQLTPPRWWMGSRRFRFGLAAQRMLGSFLEKYPFRELLDIYGGISLSQIDALVDVSGFAFTDQWGSAPIRDFSCLARAYKKRGKPVVMLPQGFGPFDHSGSQRAMKKLTESVDLAYARDDVSLRHARSVASDPQRIRKAPDITLFYPEKIQEVRPAEKASHSCIIPNVRMLDQGEEEWGSRYEGFITQLGNTLKRCGERVCLVVHDTTGKDLEIARRVQEAMDSTPEIVQKEDPLSLKSFIGESRLVITSRYHGAIAAFSKAVPSLCLGWAHKYEMLYKDFDCFKYMLRHGSSIDQASKMVTYLINSKQNNKLRHKIFNKLDVVEDANIKMWNHILDTIHR